MLGAVGGTMVVLILVGLVTFYKVEKDKKNVKEDIDINPDYGYNTEGM